AQIFEFLAGRNEFRRSQLARLAVRLCSFRSRSSVATASDIVLTIEVPFRQEPIGEIHGEREQIPGAPPQAALTNLADLPRQPRENYGFCRLLYGADHPVPDSLRFPGAGARPAPSASWRHRASDRRVDSSVGAEFRVHLSSASLPGPSSSTAIWCPSSVRM